MHVVDWIGMMAVTALMVVWPWVVFSLAALFALALVAFVGFWGLYGGLGLAEAGVRLWRRGRVHTCAPRPLRPYRPRRLRGR